MDKIERKLIECVRQHVCLYNNKHKKYKNHFYKNEIWQQVAAEMSMLAPECKQKWNMLRNAYQHALTRRKTGQGHFKKWKYADEMSFLLPFMENRQKGSGAFNDAEPDNTNGEFEMVQVQDEDECEENSSDAYQVMFDTTEEKNDKYVQYSEGTSQSETFRNNRSYNNIKEKDDIDLFFESMAKAVKALPRLKQLQLKVDIMKMVSQVEARCLEKSNRGDSVSPFESSPPNLRDRKETYFIHT